jgi:thioredoxin-related protein
MLRMIVIALMCMSLQGAEIAWHKSYAAATEAAKKSKKPMLVYMYSDCGACKYIDTKVIVDAKIADYINKHFIPVSLSPKNDAPKTLQVAVTPVFHYVNADGKLIQDDTIGATTVSSFLQDMRMAVNESK